MAGCSILHAKTGSDPQKPSLQVRKQAQRGTVTCPRSHSKEQQSWYSLTLCALTDRVFHSSKPSLRCKGPVGVCPHWHPQVSLILFMSAAVQVLHPSLATDGNAEAQGGLCLVAVSTQSSARASLSLAGPVLQPQPYPVLSPLLPPSSQRNLLGRPVCC